MSNSIFKAEIHIRLFKKNPFYKFQKLAIPSLLSGQSSILVAETGCGKTLSFLAPLVQQILAGKSSPNYQPALNAPLALIITPGRELVFQIGVRERKPFLDFVFVNGEV